MSFSYSAVGLRTCVSPVPLLGVVIAKLQIVVLRTGMCAWSRNNSISENETKSNSHKLRVKLEKLIFYTKTLCLNSTTLNN
jgi:hypothetical protein